jgi:hypothetical protein
MQGERKKKKEERMKSFKQRRAKADRSSQRMKRGMKKSHPARVKYGKRKKGGMINVYVKRKC